MSCFNVRIRNLHFYSVFPSVAVEFYGGLFFPPVCLYLFLRVCNIAERTTADVYTWLIFPCWIAALPLLQIGTVGVVGSSFLFVINQSHVSQQFTESSTSQGFKRTPNTSSGWLCYKSPKKKTQNKGGSVGFVVWSCALSCRAENEKLLTHQISLTWGYCKIFLRRTGLWTLPLPVQGGAVLH